MKTLKKINVARLPHHFLRCEQLQSKIGGDWFEDTTQKINVLKELIEVVQKIEKVEKHDDLICVDSLFDLSEATRKLGYFIDKLDAKRRKRWLDEEENEELRALWYENEKAILDTYENYK